MRLILKYCVMSILSFVLLGAVKPNNCRLVCQWESPKYIAIDGDCANTLFQITSENQQYIDYMIRWRVVGTIDWRLYRTTQPQLILTNLPCSTSVELEISPTWRYNDKQACAFTLTLPTENTPTSCMTLATYW